MEYMGYIAVAIVALVVGWFLRRPKPCSSTKIYVTLEYAGGQWTKKVSPNPASINTKDKIKWHFDTPKDAHVTVNDFRDKKTNQPKNPLRSTPSGPVHHGKIDSIPGECRGNEIFDETPPGCVDAFGRYQDFTYKLTLNVDGRTIDIDPEIRIRDV